VSDFELRPGTDQDLPIVYSATAKSLRSSPLYRDLPPDQWTQIVNGLIARMTTAPWQLTIATPTGFPSEVAGFVLGRPDKPAIGSVYVKSAYRRQGVARMLLESVTSGRPDFLAVLAQPRVLGWCRDEGLKPQLSPYYL
jgi:GNAT superfamily N-acetyltransferase